MARQRLKSVQLPKCGHFVLVPAYQSAKPQDYADHECNHVKCVEARTGKGKK